MASVTKDMNTDPGGTFEGNGATDFPYVAGSPGYVRARGVRWWNGGAGLHSARIFPLSGIDQGGEFDVMYKFDKINLSTHVGVLQLGAFKIGQNNNYINNICVQIYDRLDDLDPGVKGFYFGPIIFDGLGQVDGNIYGIKFTGTRWTGECAFLASTFYVRLHYTAGTLTLTVYDAGMNVKGTAQAVLSGGRTLSVDSIGYGNPGPVARHGSNPYVEGWNSHLSGQMGAEQEFTYDFEGNFGKVRGTLPNGDLYESPAFQCVKNDKITGTAYADQDGIVRVRQSVDGVNFDHYDDFAITGGQGMGYSIEAIGFYYKIEIINNSGSNMNDVKSGWKTNSRLV